jgi:hypothetical protein
MADILQPDKNSRENLKLFIDSIADDDVRDLIRSNLDRILTVGTLEIDTNTSQANRDLFFKAVEDLIHRKLDVQP